MSEQIKHASLWGDALRRLRQNRPAWISLWALLLLSLIALFTPWMAPYADYTTVLGMTIFFATLIILFKLLADLLLLYLAPRLRDAPR